MEAKELCPEKQLEPCFHIVRLLTSSVMEPRSWTFSLALIVHIVQRPAGPKGEPRLAAGLELLQLTSATVVDRLSRCSHPSFR